MSKIIIDDQQPGTDLHTDVSVWPTALKWGLIGAVINSALTMVYYNAGLMNIGADGAPSNWWTTVVGSVLIVLFLVLGLKEYKRLNANHLGFGKGLLFSLAYGILGGLVAGAFTYVFFEYLAPDYIDMMRENQYAQFEEQGLDDEQIEEAIDMMDSFLSPISMFFSSIFSTTFISMLGGGIASIFMKTE